MIMPSDIFLLQVSLLFHDIMHINFQIRKFCIHTFAFLASSDNLPM